MKPLFAMTFRALIAASLILCWSGQALALSAAPPAPPAPPAPAAPPAASAGENYGFYCAQCHGIEGRGDGPNATRNMPVDTRDFTNPDEMNALTDEDISEAITDGVGAIGKSTLMPPFGATLSGEEILALKDYIRGLCNCPAR